MTADGRGEAAMPVTRWLWLPAEDGSITVANPADIPETARSSAGSVRGLRAVSAGADAPGYGLRAPPEAARGRAPVPDRGPTLDPIRPTDPTPLLDRRAGP